MDFKEVITQRRAVNFFNSEKPVPEHLLREMIELAAMTPSGFNLQPWNLMVLTDPAEKAKLQSLAWNQTKITEAPVVLMVLADCEGWKAGHPVVEHNFKQMVATGAMKEEQLDWFLNAAANLYGANESKRMAFACKNAGFFCMSLMLAAKHLGLDTHPMDGFDHDGVKQAFNIPERFWLPLLLAVGYLKPDTAFSPAKWRKTYQEIVLQPAK